jgi:hypothetical protein
MSKHLVIRNGFLLFSDSTEHQIITGVTNYDDYVNNGNQLQENDFSLVSERAVKQAFIDFSATVSGSTGAEGTVQLSNGSGAFAGDSDFSWSTSTKSLTVNGSLILSGTQEVTGVTNSITDPGSDYELATTSSIVSYIEDQLSGFTTTLSGLTDTNITTPLQDQLLVYDGTEWVNSGISGLLGDYYTKTESDGLFYSISGGTLYGDVTIDSTYNLTLTQGDVTVSNGDLTVYGTTRLIGDLFVTGTTTYINVTDLNVSDNIITINSGETSSGITLGNAGIKIDRGTSDPYYFIFNEATESFRIGIADDLESALPGDTQAVATREDNPDANGIAFWNAVESRFDTDTNFTWNGSNLNVGTTGTIDGVNISEFYDDYNTFTGSTVYTFSGLSDTTIDNPVEGEIVVYLTATEWTSTGISYFYNDLDSRYAQLSGISSEITDVDSTNLATISAITYYVDEQLSGFTTTLEGLSDTNITTPLSSQLLVYDGVEWVNSGKSDYLSEYYTKTESDDEFVSRSGDTMTGDLTISTLTGTGDRLVYVDNNGQLRESDEYIYKTEITGVNGAGNVIDSIDSGVSFGCVWNYYIQDGINFRSGIITTTWGNGDVAYNETSTQDIGDTTEVEFSVTLSTGNVKLQADGGTGTWTIKVARLTI